MSSQGLAELTALGTHSLQTPRGQEEAGRGAPACTGFLCKPSCAFAVRAQAEGGAVWGIS